MDIYLFNITVYQMTLASSVCNGLSNDDVKFGSEV